MAVLVAPVMAGSALSDPYSLAGCFAVEIGAALAGSVEDRKVVALYHRFAHVLFALFAVDADVLEEPFHLYQ